jgi:hypothetical protein
LEDLRVGGRILLKDVLKKQVQVVDRISLAEDRDKWHRFVYTVMNFAVPLNTEWLLIGGRSLLDSQYFRIKLVGRTPFPPS